MSAPLFLANPTDGSERVHVARSDHSHVRTLSLCGVPVRTRGGPLRSARYFYHSTYPTGALKRYPHYCAACVRKATAVLTVAAVPARKVGR
jgi:hypothetical protein